MRQLDNNIANFIVIKETEKAVALKGWKSPVSNPNKAWEYVMWIPKSCIKDGIIAGWILSKRYSDLRIEGYDITLEVR